MSQFTELYTQTFGTRVAKTILASKKVHELPVTANLSLTADGSDQVEEPDLKRRRMNGKMSPLPACRDHMPEPGQNHASRRKEILDQAMTIAPRVGKKILEDGDIFDSIQGLFPEEIGQPLNDLITNALLFEDVLKLIYPRMSKIMMKLIQPLSGLRIQGFLNLCPWHMVDSWSLDASQSVGDWTVSWGGVTSLSAAGTGTGLTSWS